MYLTEAPQEEDGVSSDAVGLNLLFISKIEGIVNDEHLVNTIKECFVEYKINYNYFQNHKRKDLVNLLRKYKIKVSIAVKLWAEFINNKDKYVTNNIILHRLIYGYSHKYFNARFQDGIKLIMYYYASIDILRLIEASLNQINWNNLKLIKSQSPNHNTINKSISISQKAMNMFCSVALKRLNNNYNKNLIQIGKKEWVLIVNVIDDDGNYDVGVSFKYNDKFINLFAATAIYLDFAEIESKHKLIGVKYNHCKNITPFSLRNFQFINGDQIIEINQYEDDNDHNDVTTSSLELQSDDESI